MCRDEEGRDPRGHGLLHLFRDASYCSSRRKPILMVTCQSATLPSSRWPRTSLTSNQSRLRRVWEALAIPFRTASSTPSVEVPTISEMLYVWLDNFAPRDHRCSRLRAVPEA